MFKSRSGSQGNSATQAPQSIEAVRRRARHRLIGASVLVLLGVLGFPLLFDTQPRPISVDIPIEIPSRNQAPDLVVPKKAAVVDAEPAPAAPTAPATTAAAAAAPALSTPVSPAESLSAREEVVPSSAPVAKPPVVAQARAPAKAAPAKAAPAPAPAPSPTAERIVVQVGAFADATRAREVRLKVESTGLKTYTHVAQTAEGSRIRVRVGPFTSRAEAEKAAARIKAKGLPVAILTL